jgi:hypothetical protein
LNYKKAVEKHYGFLITVQQGKQYFYKPQYVQLVRMYAKGEPLPEVTREVEVIPTAHSVSDKREREGAEIVLSTRKLSTRKLAVPEPMQVRPLHLVEVDTAAMDTQTTHNQALLSTFKQHIRAQVLGEAAVFGEELKAQVKHTLTRATAEAYQELLKE